MKEKKKLSRAEEREERIKNAKSFEGARVRIPFDARPVPAGGDPDMRRQLLRVRETLVLDPTRSTYHGSRCERCVEFPSCEKMIGLRESLVARALNYCQWPDNRFKWNGVA